MYKLTSNIQIGEYTIRGFKSLKVNKNIDNIVDTAVIKLPTTGVLKREGKAPTKIDYAKELKRGQAVSFSIGYDGDNREVFNGFINKIEHTDPVKITCNDWSYKLKNSSINEVYEEVSLKSVLNEICSGTGIEVDADNITLKNLKLHKGGQPITKLEALKKIREHIGITVYFYGQTLYAGLKYGRETGTVKFKFQHNIIDESSLEWKNKEDIRVQVKAVNIKPDGTRQTVSVGDTSNESSTQTYYFHEIENTQKLKELAQEKLEEVDFTGYKGDFTAFLKPEAKPTQKVELINDTYPDKSGVYYITGVEYTFGSNGGRQKITIGSEL